MVIDGRFGFVITGDTDKMKANELAESAAATAGTVVGGVAAAGAGFLAADALDRLLATYDPSGSPPADKFTSSGTSAGTLANTLNISSAPGPLRIAAAVGMVAAPAIGAAVVEDDAARYGLEAVAVGAGVSLVKTLVNNLLMPLLAPKDTSVPSLQKSYIARLYPAEVSATINRHATPPMTSVSSAGSGALSDPSYPQLGAGDSSPYDDVEQALAHGLRGDSQYDDTGRALRRAAGLHGSSPYPDVSQTFMGADPATVAPPAPPPTTVAPPAAVAATADKIASTVAASLPGLSPAQAKNAADHVVAAPPQHVEAALQNALPHVDPAAIKEVAKRAHPHVARLHGQASTWMPGPPADVGPGPKSRQPSEEQCGCGSPADLFFLGDEDTSETPLFGIGDLVAEVQRRLDPAGRSNGKSNGAY